MIMHKKLKILFLVLTLVLSHAVHANGEINYIDIHQAKELYDDGALFIDARTWFEQKLGKIDGALAMKKSQVKDVAQYLITDKNQTVVTYCAVGARASETADQLQTLGYTNIHVIANGQGFSNWKKAGYPVAR